MDPFLGEIRLVAFNYAPRGWALCNGALVSISSNSALYALLGTNYGGDGRTTFALPDLRSRAALHTGQGAGLSRYSQGTLVGTEGVTLLLNEMAAHTHAVAGDTLPFKTNSAVSGSTPSPAGAFLAKSASNQYGEETGNLTMIANSVTGTGSTVGGNLPHENRMPFLTMNFIIATSGIFPPRS